MLRSRIVRLSLAAGAIGGLILVLIPQPPAGDQRARRAAEPAQKRARQSAVPEIAAAGTPPAAPLRAYPDRADVLAATLYSLSYAVGEDAVADYNDYLELLRSDPVESAEMLQEALRGLPAHERDGQDARPIIYAIGQIGAPSSLELLESMVAEPLPASDGHHHADAREQATITRSMAIDAIGEIGAQHGDPDTLAQIRASLEELLATADLDPHLAITAVHTLLMFAADRERERDRLAALLGGDRAALARIAVREPTDDHR